MYAMQTTIRNTSGLHARPASEFIAMAKTFQSNVMLRNLDRPEAAAVNAKSIVRVLAEGIAKGTHIEISADGGDAKEAVEALVAFVDSGFGEE